MGSAPSRRRQRGVALLVAIMLVALGTIIAAAMAYNNAMTARRAAATFEFDQALLVAEGAEALAAYGLQQQFQQRPPSIYPGQPWSQPLPPTPVMPGVTLEASLEDLQGRFNINTLVGQDGHTPNTAAIQAFQRLLTMLGLDPKFADDLVNWVDNNPTPMFPDSAGDSVYLEMDPPYRTPEMPITSTSELMALPGFTRADFDKVAPFIVALPLSPATTINVCSASPWLLDALSGVKQFSADPAAFEKQRAEFGACFPPNFLDGIENPGLKQELTSMVGQTSSWFRLTSFVSLGSTEFAVYTLLYEDTTGQVRPVMRSFTPN